MAETNPELQAKLRELDHELEEGDITQKGSVPAVTVSPPSLFRQSRCARAGPANAAAATKSDAPSCCPSI